MSTGTAGQSYITVWSKSPILHLVPLSFPQQVCPQLAPLIDAAEEEVTELGGNYLEEN